MQDTNFKSAYSYYEPRLIKTISLSSNNGTQSEVTKTSRVAV